MSELESLPLDVINEIITRTIGSTHELRLLSDVVADVAGLALSCRAMRRVVWDVTGSSAISVPPPRRCARTSHVRPMHSPISEALWDAVVDQRRARISAQKAKSAYRLTEADLAILVSHVASNPYYRNGHPMHLYKLTDVVASARRKFACDIEAFRDRSRRCVPSPSLTRERRTTQLRGLFARNGIPWEPDTLAPVASYVRNGRWSLVSVRWDALVASVKFRRDMVVGSALASAGLDPMYHTFDRRFATYRERGIGEACIFDIVDQIRSECDNTTVRARNNRTNTAMCACGNAAAQRCASRSCNKCCSLDGCVRHGGRHTRAAH
jgi:hypothetical protein